MSLLSEAQMLCRCTTCATLFRIATSELRSHSGLVRCGDCGTIFNAAWNLVDEIPSPAQLEPNNTTQKGPKTTSRKDQKTKGDLSGIASNERLFSLGDQLRQDLEMDADSSSGLAEIRQTFSETNLSTRTQHNHNQTSQDRLNIDDNPIFNLNDSPSVIGESMLPKAASQPRVNRRSTNKSSFGQRLRAQTLWLLGICIAAIGLYGQTRYLLFDELAAIAVARTPLEIFCNFSNCNVPAPLIGPAFRILETRIDLDPKLPEAVIVRVQLENRTTIPRPFPNIELVLTNKGGTIIGKRIYTGRDYETQNNVLELSPNLVSVAIIHLANPDEKAVGYKARIVGN